MNINLVWKYLGTFILLILIQVLILNNVRFGGYINPYVYVLFILLLPIDVSGWFLLVSAFFTGLTIDVFLDSPGMHTAATVFMAFCRPAVIRLISVKSDFEPGTVPGISGQGLTWIMTYSVLLVLLHHIPLFFLEIFRFTEFWQTLTRIFLNVAFSSAFVVLGFLFWGKTSRARDELL
ncbi:MAG: rod shape-determining protein MreD [Bacteroidales bacterium]